MHETKSSSFVLYSARFFLLHKMCFEIYLNFRKSVLAPFLSSTHFILNFGRGCSVWRGGEPCAAPMEASHGPLGLTVSFVLPLPCVVVHPMPRFALHAIFDISSVVTVVTCGRSNMRSFIRHRYLCDGTTAVDSTTRASQGTPSSRLVRAPWASQASPSYASLVTVPRT